MPVLLFIISIFIFVHLVLVQRILKLIRVHVLEVLEVGVLVHWHHDLTDHIVVVTLSRQDDLKFWVLPNVKD